MIIAAKARGLILGVWLLSMSGIALGMEQENEALKKENSTLKQQLAKTQQLLKQQLAELIALKKDDQNKEEQRTLIGEPGAGRMQNFDSLVGHI